MKSDPQLDEWVARAQAGDGNAFAAIVRATQTEVWRLCAYLVDAATADDLSQDTYLRALRSLSTYSGQGAFSVWLLSIARRACADELRQRGRRRRLMSRLDPPAPMADREGEVELTMLLSQLHPERREAFVLTQFIGLSYLEAAAVAGCPIGTIRSRVARARTELAGAIRERERTAGTG